FGVRPRTVQYSRGGEIEHRAVFAEATDTENVGAFEGFGVSQVPEEAGLDVQFVEVRLSGPIVGGRRGFGVGGELIPVAEDDSRAVSRSDEDFPVATRPDPAVFLVDLHGAGVGPFGRAAGTAGGGRLQGVFSQVEVAVGVEEDLFAVFGERVVDRRQAEEVGAVFLVCGLAGNRFAVRQNADQMDDPRAPLVEDVFQWPFFGGHRRVRGETRVVFEENVVEVRGVGAHQRVAGRFPRRRQVDQPVGRARAAFAQVDVAVASRRSRDQDFFAFLALPGGSLQFRVPTVAEDALRKVGVEIEALFAV